MIIPKSTILKIKGLIDKKYKILAITMLGQSVLSAAEKLDLESQGEDITNDDSVMDLAYNHNFLNEEGGQIAPTSVGDMKSQQSAPGVKPRGEAHDYAIEHANENTAQLIEKMRQDVSTRIEGIIRETNNQYKSNALQNLNRTDQADELVKEGMVGQIKTRLRDTAKNVTRDWKRVAVTEVSNVIGIGSADRIVAKNQDKNLDEVYVFRTVINDAKLCKYCKKFYLDGDGSPKLYKLSTLLSNGSNYGKKTDSWNPVITATHPNERCSQIIELPPGYKVLPGGSLTYIGMDAFHDYISNKLTA